MKFDLSGTAKVKKSKVKVTRSMKIVHENINYMPQTSFDSGNIPVL